MGFGVCVVWSLGCGVRGLKFGVQALGFRGEGSSFGGWGVGLRVEGLECTGRMVRSAARTPAFPARITSVCLLRDLRSRA